jgi:hypothetical protein
MTTFLKVIAIWLGSAAITTAILAAIARPLTRFVHRLVFGPDPVVPSGAIVAPVQQPHPDASRTAF